MVLKLHVEKVGYSTCLAVLFALHFKMYFQCKALPLRKNVSQVTWAYYTFYSDFYHVIKQPIPEVVVMQYLYTLFGIVSLQFQFCICL